MLSSTLIFNLFLFFRVIQAKVLIPTRKRTRKRVKIDGGDNTISSNLALFRYFSERNMYFF